MRKIIFFISLAFISASNIMAQESRAENNADYDFQQGRKLRDTTLLRSCLTAKASSGATTPAQYNGRPRQDLFAALGQLSIRNSQDEFTKAKHCLAPFDSSLLNGSSGYWFLLKRILPFEFITLPYGSQLFFQKNKLPSPSLSCKMVLSTN